MDPMTPEQKAAVLASLTEKTGLSGAEALARAVERGAITEAAATWVLDQLWPREDQKG